jgi:hypothetical protein
MEPGDFDSVLDSETFVVTTVDSELLSGMEDGEQAVIKLNDVITNAAKNFLVLIIFFLL